MKDALEELTTNYMRQEESRTWYGPLLEVRVPVDVVQATNLLMELRRLGWKIEPPAKGKA